MPGPTPCKRSLFRSEPPVVKLSLVNSSSMTMESANRWPHRLAVLLVVVTFPLIWVGGLVTTYEAGMAVPDWPNTYGYNMFLYPVSTWVGGPWDLFIEHGHRLLASGVGLLTLVFVVLTWRSEPRRWFRWYSLLCLGLVVAQGVLGGLRVLLDETVLARWHGCLGPLFFCSATAAAAMTSTWWRRANEGPLEGVPGGLVRLLWATVGVAYLQLILGAHLRHVPATWSPQTFQAMVLGHLAGALALTVHVGAASWTVFRSPSLSKLRLVRWPATALSGLLAFQLLLGAAAWRLKYDWPVWLPQPKFLRGYTVQAESMVQSLTLTAHVALGSLVLVTALLLHHSSFTFDVSRRRGSYLRHPSRSDGGCGMSTSTLVQVRETRNAGIAGRLADYVELLKPRILTMVLVTVSLSGVIATWGHPDVLSLVHTLLGITLVAGSASVFNQWLERAADGRMRRTQNRPLASGRLTQRETIVLGSCGVLFGLAYLVNFSSPAAAFWAGATWLLYVGVYTPLKTRTWLNTLVGAIPGALPVLIGWTGAGGSIDTRGVCLFLLVFLWQFPHFMAIAWLYRHQYAAAGMQMLTVVDPTGRRAGVQACVAGFSVLMVSLVPATLMMHVSVMYLVASLILGTAQLACAVLFAVRRDDARARRLLRASLIYLPLQLILITLLNLGLI